MSFVLTLLVLPGIALIAKTLYKNFCSQNIKLKGQETEKEPLHSNKPQAQDVIPQMLNEKPHDVNRPIASHTIEKTQISLKLGNLLKENSDVLVNAANASLIAGGGVCGAFKKFAGEAIFEEECAEIKKTLNVSAIPVGHAVMTSKGNLKNGQAAILHAVGPSDSDPKKLAEVIENCLKMTTGMEIPDHYVSDKLEAGKKYRTIAMPAISTGIFAYQPIEKAAEIIFKTTQMFIQEHPDALDEVNFVFLDPDDPQSNDDQTANVFLKIFNQLFKGQKMDEDGQKMDL